MYKVRDSGIARRSVLWSVNHYGIVYGTDFSERNEDTLECCFIEVINSGRKLLRYSVCVSVEQYPAYTNLKMESEVCSES